MVSSNEHKRFLPLQAFPLFNYFKPLLDSSCFKASFPPLFHFLPCSCFHSHFGSGLEKKKKGSRIGGEEEAEEEEGPGELSLFFFRDLSLSLLTENLSDEFWFGRGEREMYGTRIIPLLPHHTPEFLHKPMAAFTLLFRHFLAAPRRTSRPFHP